MYPFIETIRIEQGKSNNITTENYLKIEPQIGIGNVILMSIVDYDYVLKEFVAKPYTGSIFQKLRQSQEGQTEVCKKQQLYA